MSIATKYLMSIPGVRGVLSRASEMYRASVTSELRKYGLRYDDLLNEFDDDVQQALKELPKEEVEMRNKRLKRALDLDMKSTYLSEDLQKQVDVWNPYLSKRVDLLKTKRLERQTYD